MYLFNSSTILSSIDWSRNFEKYSVGSCITILSSCCDPSTNCKFRFRFSVSIFSFPYNASFLHHKSYLLNTCEVANKTFFKNEFTHTYFLRILSYMREKTASIASNIDFVKSTEAVVNRNVYNIPVLFELVIAMLSSDSSSLSISSSSSVSLSLVIWKNSL